MNLEQLLGDEADSPARTTRATAFPSERLTLPGPDVIDEVFRDSDRSPTVLRNLGTLYGTGRLAGTGLRVDPPGRPGHRALGGGQLRQVPRLLRPGPAVRPGHRRRLQRHRHHPRRASGIVSRRYVHRIPFIVKLNHNDFLNYPNTYDQIMFSEVRQAADLGRGRRRGHHLLRLRGRRPPDRRGLPGLRRGPPARACSPCCGATCATRPSSRDDTDYHVSADLTGQANHLGRDHRGRHHQAEAAGEQRRLQRPRVRQDRPAGLQRADHRPPDRPDPVAGRELLRRPDPADQLGRASPRAPTTWPRPSAPRWSTSGPAAPGLIVGRKAFQRPTDEGAALIHAIQDVYLDAQVTIA